MTTGKDIELRFARADEADAVRRLAELDSAPELTGQVVIAVLNGEPVAGLSLLDERVVADPFVSTTEAIALLRLRAAQLSGGTSRRNARQVLRLRSGSALKSPKALAGRR
jgi:hypothetical protein